MCVFFLFGRYLRCVSPEGALGGESFAADVTVEGTVLHPLELGVVVAEMLLKVRKLDEGASAVRDVAFVRPFTCNGEGKVVMKRNGMFPSEFLLLFLFL